MVVITFPTVITVGKSLNIRVFIIPMAVAKTAQKPNTEKTPVFSQDVNWRLVSQAWEVLTNEEYRKNAVVRIFSKRLAWISNNVILGGKNLWEMWKYAHARASEAGLKPLGPREIKEVAIEVDSAVNFFLQSLYYADIIGTTPAPYISKDPITEAIELAWQIVYDGEVRYLVLRISSEGISAEVSRSFIGKPARGFLRNCL